MNRRDTRGYPKPSPRRVAGAPSYEYPTLPTQSRSGAFPCEEAYSSGVDAIKNDGRNSYCGGTMQQGSSTSFSPISSGSGGSGLVSASSGLGSRKSSAHSVQNISDPPSDDSDDDIGPPEAKKGQGFRERRREAHTQAEQKRRDAIKKGYNELEEELPTMQETVGSQKPSKAVVLQRSIDYVNFLEEQKQKQAEELESLKKDHMGLQIMKQAYEKMALALRNQPDQGNTPVPDAVKFQVFQLIMENLFQSFDNRVVTSSFAELSGSAFNWLEEYEFYRDFAEGAQLHWEHTSTQ